MCQNRKVVFFQTCNNSFLLFSLHVASTLCTINQTVLNTNLYVSNVNLITSNSIFKHHYTLTCVIYYSSRVFKCLIIEFTPILLRILPVEHRYKINYVCYTNTVLTVILCIVCLPTRLPVRIRFLHILWMKLFRTDYFVLQCYD